MELLHRNIHPHRKAISSIHVILILILLLLSLLLSRLLLTNGVMRLLPDVALHSSEVGLSQISVSMGNHLPISAKLYRSIFQAKAIILLLAYQFSL
jgi:hypothetical protein